MEGETNIERKTQARERRETKNGKGNRNEWE